jgi:hypothetical protein
MTGAVVHDPPLVVVRRFRLEPLPGTVTRARPAGTVLALACLPSLTPRLDALVLRVNGVFGPFEDDPPDDAA